MDFGLLLGALLACAFVLFAVMLVSGDPRR